MLPPGHLAAGYLTAYGLIHLSDSSFTPSETTILLAAGAILGAIPDIDFLAFFFSRKSLRFVPNDTHRKYLTHAPLIWLIAGFIIVLGAPNAFIRAFGFLLWLSPWSHFLGDSLEFGVRWLWPFSSRYFSLWNSPERDLSEEKTIFKHYAGIIRFYAARSKTFLLETVLVFAALAVIARDIIP